MIPQNIRVEVNEEELNAISAGVKTFVVLKTEVRIDDYITFVLENSDDVDPIVKKVGYVDGTVTKDDKFVVGLLPPEYGTLVPFFSDNRFLLAYGIEKNDDGIREIISSSYLPPLTAPAVPFAQIASILKMHEWPNGHYSIMLNAKENPPKDGEQQIEIQDVLISVRVKDDEERIVFTEVDQLHLYSGALKDIDGNDIEAFIPSKDEEEIADEIRTSLLETEEIEETEEDWIHDELSDVLDKMTEAKIQQE